MLNQVFLLSRIMSSARLFHNDSQKLRIVPVTDSSIMIAKSRTINEILGKCGSGAESLPMQPNSEQKILDQILRLLCKILPDYRSPCSKVINSSKSICLRRPQNLEVNSRFTADHTMWLQDKSFTHSSSTVYWEEVQSEDGSNNHNSRRDLSVYVMSPSLLEEQLFTLALLTLL
ncbi:hypothetical protein YC2023_101408 [Brassica napus]